MSRQFRCRIFTAETLVRSWASILEIVVDEMELQQGGMWVLQVSPVSIIPPVLHTGLCLRATLTRRTNGRNLWPFKSFGNRGALDGKVLSLLLSSEGVRLSGVACLFLRIILISEWTKSNLECNANNVSSRTRKCPCSVWLSFCPL
jgi:hypothetical protein